jgi:hypothetical protein
VQRSRAEESCGFWVQPMAMAHGDGGPDFRFGKAKEPCWRSSKHTGSGRRDRRASAAAGEGAARDPRARHGHRAVIPGACPRDTQGCGGGTPRDPVLACLLKTVLQIDAPHTTIFLTDDSNGAGSTPPLVQDATRQPSYAAALHGESQNRFACASRSSGLARNSSSSWQAAAGLLGDEALDGVGNALRGDVAEVPRGAVAAEGVGALREVDE